MRYFFLTLMLTIIENICLASAAVVHLKSEAKKEKGIMIMMPKLTF